MGQNTVHWRQVSFLYMLLIADITEYFRQCLLLPHALASLLSCSCLPSLAPTCPHCCSSYCSCTHSWVLLHLLMLFLTCSCLLFLTALSLLCFLTHPHSSSCPLVCCLVSKLSFSLFPYYTVKTRFLNYSCLENPLKYLFSSYAFRDA